VDGTRHRRPRADIPRRFHAELTRCTAPAPAELFRVIADAEKAISGKDPSTIAVIGLLAVKVDPHGLGEAIFRREIFALSSASVFVVRGEEKYEIHGVY